MRILFDQGTPLPLRDALVAVHEVRTAYELGWSTTRNGELLAEAERQFDLLVTTDRNLQRTLGPAAMRAGEFRQL